MPPVGGRTATTTYPATINTELIGSISQEVVAGAMKKTYDAYGIAPNGLLVWSPSLPDDAVVNEFTVGPANQPW